MALSERQKALRKEKMEYVRKLKEETPCADCGESYHGCQMDFDHLDPSTKYKRVSHMYTASYEMIDEEIAKCEIVCANCHRLRTHLRLLMG